MNSILRILIPFDFSPAAKNALVYALKFCTDNYHSNIMLCYVADSSSFESKQEEMKTYLATVSVPTYVAIDGKVMQGNFVDALLNEQLDYKADMMVMGTKGADESSEKAISSTSRMTLGAHCPVLVIPVDYKDFKIKKITLAISKDKIEDPTVLSTLLVIARRYAAKIHVLTIYDEEDEDYYLETKNEGVLKYYFEKYYSYNSSSRSGNIGDSIMEYDKSHGMDLLAIIPRNHKQESTPSEGTLTKFLTLKTNIPLLTMNK